MNSPLERMEELFTPHEQMLAREAAWTAIRYLRENGMAGTKADERADKLIGAVAEYMTACKS